MITGLEFLKYCIQNINDKSVIFIADNNYRITKRNIGLFISESDVYYIEDAITHDYFGVNIDCPIDYYMNSFEYTETLKKFLDTTIRKYKIDNFLKL